MGASSGTDGHGRHLVSAQDVRLLDVMTDDERERLGRRADTRDRKIKQWRTGAAALLASTRRPRPDELHSTCERPDCTGQTAAVVHKARLCAPCTVEVVLTNVERRPA